jgi:hypothetical protein
VLNWACVNGNFLYNLSSRWRHRLIMHTQEHTQQLFMSLKTHYNKLSLYLSLDSAGRHVGEKIKTFLWVLYLFWKDSLGTWSGIVEQ